MSQIAKLYARALANPDGLSFREFQRLLATFGFVQRRQRGSHRSYGHPASGGLLVIQPRGSQAKGYQVRQFLDMVRLDGLTLDEQ